MDVKCILLEDSMSFRLAFEFGPNEYFTNTTLEKTYHLVDDDEPILEKAEVRPSSHRCCRQTLDAYSIHFRLLDSAMRFSVAIVRQTPAVAQI